MTGLHKYFQWVTLPTSDETGLGEAGLRKAGLGEAVTKEMNHAMERILKEKNEVPIRKRKYTHFSSKNRAKIAKYTSLPYFLWETVGISILKIALLLHMAKIGKFAFYDHAIISRITVPYNQGVKLPGSVKTR